MLSRKRKIAFLQFYNTKSKERKLSSTSIKTISSLSLKVFVLQK